MCISIYAPLQRRNDFTDANPEYWSEYAPKAQWGFVTLATKAAKRDIRELGRDQKAITHFLIALDKAKGGRKSAIEKYNAIQAVRRFVAGYRRSKAVQA